MVDVAHNDNVRMDRRRFARVVANGSVLLRGGASTHGRIVDLSSGGLCMHLGDGEPPAATGDQVALELHLDRAGSRWLRFAADVVRVDGDDVALAFTAVPLGFAGVIQAVLRSMLEGASVAHVLLVDADTERRAAFAALLRAAACRVREAATPLEAIAHLGTSAIARWVVAIAETSPASVAEELRAFLADSDPGVEVVMIDAHAAHDALAAVIATGHDAP